MRCMRFYSVPSGGDNGLDDDDYPPVLFKGTVERTEFYQVGLPFMGPEPGMVSGNHCLSFACKGDYCWHKSAKLRASNELDAPVQGEFYFLKHLFRA